MILSREGVSELTQAIPIDLELDVLVWGKGRFLVYRNSSCILETGFHSVVQTNRELAIKSRQASNSKQFCVQLPKTQDYGHKSSSMAVGTAEWSQSLDLEGMGKQRGEAREGMSNREGVGHAPRKRQHRQWHQSSHTFRLSLGRSDEDLAYSSTRATRGMPCPLKQPESLD